MRKIIVKFFIKDHENYQDANVRLAYGKLSGVVGMVSNFLLMAVKIATGLVIGSLAIVADGINNLSDIATSVITFVGFRLAGLPADKKHPFGHQRIEYVTGLFVAVFIFTVGLLIAFASVDKIVNPREVNYNWPVIALLAFAVLVKIWQSYFYRKNGKLIQSKALMATAVDSLNDVIATAGILVTGLVMIFYGVNLDGYMSAIVSVIIIINGVRFVFKTVSQLIGEAPSPEYAEKLLAAIREYEGVLGVHDLVIHQYGPVKKFVTAHVEIDSRVDIVQSHRLIDNIEREVSRRLDCDLVIHMDPVNPDCRLTDKYRRLLKNLLNDIDPLLSFHDFQIIKSDGKTELIFDVVIPFEYKGDLNNLRDKIREKIGEADDSIYPIIKIDREHIP